MFTKSGLMVGLGEDNAEVLQVMDDLRAAQVDFLTIGQYLQPTVKHHAIDRFVPPTEFDSMKRQALWPGTASSRTSSICLMVLSPSGSHSQIISVTSPSVVSMVRGPTRKSKYGALLGKRVKFVRMRGPDRMDG